MPQDLTCPKCAHVFPVTETREPFGIQCPGCDVELTAEFKKLASPAPGQPLYELVVKVGKCPGAGRGTEAKAMRLDDEEEEKQRRGGSMAMVAIVGTTALLITLGGLGTAGYFMFSADGLDTSEYKSSGGGKSGGGNSGGNKGGNTGGGNKGGNTGGGQDFVSDQWKFAAKFPSKPQEQQQGGGKIFLVENGDNAFTVAVSEMPGDGKMPQAQMNLVLDNARDGLVRGVNGTATNKKNISITGKQQYPGREVTATVTQPKQLEVLARVFLVGKRLYMVMVVGSNQFVTSNEAKEFMKSFRLVE